MDLSELSPAYVRSIAPYQPGKPISELARELGLDERKIVKLASNENPRGVGPRTRAAIDAAFSSPAGRAAMAHAAEFIGEITTFLVEPHVIV